MNSLGHATRKAASHCLAIYLIGISNEGSYMNNNFFPLCAELVESLEFKKLPVTEKLFLIQLISDSNINPEGWYKADLEYAIALKVSINKIRQARPRLKKLGFIDYESGQLKANRKFATRYTFVKYSRPEPPFSKVHRYTYTSLLTELREESISHPCLLFWLLSAYKYGRSATDGFSVYKSFYADYGIKSKALSQAVDSINNTFSEEFIDQNYHKMIFSEFTWFSDPDVCDKNKRFQKREEADLKELINYHKKESNHDAYWKEKRAMELVKMKWSDKYIMEELGISQSDLNAIIADESSRMDF